mmetsp:Transcript_17764/g.49569  ORF Transcript_17764/g.49569 Transcript_17764/m.49569 type:complete len:244 (-) Transcript_17764:3072-3803(-)
MHEALACRLLRWRSASKSCRVTSGCAECMDTRGCSFAAAIRCAKLLPMELAKAVGREAGGDCCGSAEELSCVRGLPIREAVGPRVNMSFTRSSIGGLEDEGECFVDSWGRVLLLDSLACKSDWPRSQPAGGLLSISCGSTRSLWAPVERLECACARPKADGCCVLDAPEKDPDPWRGLTEGRGPMLERSWSDVMWRGRPDILGSSADLPTGWSDANETWASLEDTGMCTELLRTCAVPANAEP